MIYFTADTHFNHAGIIKLCQRPFETVAHMNDVLVGNWNAMVGPDDEIYILGDFAFKGKWREATAVLDRLNGRKYLVRGNHDTYLQDADFDETYFEWVRYYHAFSYKKTKFVLFHYPIFEWDGFYRDSIHLYGHVHNNDPEKFAPLDKRAINVGVDMHGYCPVSIERVMKLAGYV